MPDLAGYINYDDRGKPYMGLLFTDKAVKVEVFLGYAEQGMAFANEMLKMAKELRTMPDKIMEVKGNGLVRPVQGDLRKRKG